MKKNMLTIIILALAMVNVVLSAVIVFVVVPASNKTSKLISQVASVVDLELESPEAEEEKAVVTVADKEEYIIEGEQTFNLKVGSDGKNHFGVLSSITLSINKSSPDYKKLNPTIETNKNAIVNIAGNVISSYSFDNANDSKQEMQEKILEQVQELFGSDFIVDVYTSLVFQ